MSQPITPDDIFTLFRESEHLVENTTEVVAIEVKSHLEVREFGSYLEFNLSAQTQDNYLVSE